MKGAAEEKLFWRNFTKSERFIKGWLPDIKTPELPQYVYERIVEMNPANALDCGSGAASILTGTVKNIVATDLLAKDYHDMVDYKQYPHVAIPIPLACEEIAYDQEFDLVHMSNALDHTQQPNVAFEKLLTACKIGGHVIIQGFVDEAIFENWHGMHQWNINSREGKFVIEGRKDKFAYTPKEADTLMVVTLDTGKLWIILIIAKDGSEKLEVV